MNPGVENELKIQLDRINAEIAFALKAAKRHSGETTLIAVSKTVDSDKIESAIVSGQTIFGENRVNEAKKKWPDLLNRFPNVELHLLGSLQSNKVRDAVKLFDVIQSVDRISIAEAIAKEVEKQAKQVKIFIQVNTGQEPQKGGVEFDELSALIGKCKQLGLNVVGLMCIPAALKDPDPDFRALAQAGRQFLLPNLSMGMSGDFKKAISCGSTHVRVGTAIFGSRAYK